MDSAIERKQVVAQLAAVGLTRPGLIAERLAERGITGRGGRAFSARTIQRDLAESAPLEDGKGIVKEIIGRATGANDFWYSNRFVYTVDRTRSDYRFWDRLRNGVARGYELVGALCQPACDILATYVFGDAPTYVLTGDELDEDQQKHTEADLARFIERNHALLLQALSEEYALGDQWILINPNGSLTIPSPDTVTPKFDPSDPKKLVQVEIRTSDLGIIVTDTYRADGRTLKIQRGGNIQTLEFVNPIGRLPVVQWSNSRRSNELFGRAIYEALLPVFQHFDDLLMKQLAGAKVMQNPIPVVEGLENITDTIANNSTQEPLQYRDPFSNLVTAPQVVFDTNGIWYLGKGANAKMLGPQVGFSGDARDTLHQLFQLMLNHIGIPEILWGATVEVTRSTAEIQMPPFIRRINARRVLVDGVGAADENSMETQGGMFEVIDIYLRMRHLVDPDILIAPTQGLWPTVSETEDAVRLQKIIYARGQQMVDKVEGLQLLNLVTDATASVERADEEAALNPQPTDDFMQQLNSAAHTNMQPDNGAPDEPNVKPESLPPLPDGGRRARQPKTGKPVGETTRERIA